MNGKERILNTLKGEKTDRVPIWLMGPFARDLNLDSNDWTAKDSRFIELKRFYDDNCEIFRPYYLPGSNRLLCTPSDYVTLEEQINNQNYQDSIYSIHTPKGDLRKASRAIKDVATSWALEYPVKEIGDIYKLMSVDFGSPTMDFSKFFESEKQLDSKGAMVVYVNTPMITASSTMPFEDFLVYTMTDFELIKEMTTIAFERTKYLVRKAIEAGLGPIYRIQGCEQATPPMNRFEVYHELIFKFEKELIDMIHKSGNFAAIHCHGKVKTVLPEMLKMGVDLLDPVEPPPSGDIEFHEAKKVADHKMTLAGNIEYDDLERKTPEEIENQIKALFADGQKDHVVIAATSWPITYMSEPMYNNFKMLLTAGIREGRIK